MHTSTATPKKERIDIGIAIIVILLFAAFGIYQGFADQSAAPSVMSQLSSDITAVNDRTPITISDKTYTPLAMTTDDRTVVKPERIAPITPVVVSQHNSMRTKAAESTAIVDSTQLSAIVAADTIVADTTTGVSTVAIGSDTPIENNIQPQPATKTDLKTGDPASSEACMIIIGSFSRQPNVNKLLQSLRDDGHRPFTTPHKGMTRVGVYSSCDNTILYTKLRSISSKYAADAFALKNSN
jgi:cell division septation protein DedD